MTTPWTITIDCVAPAALAEFWSSVLGYVPAAPPEGFQTWQEWFMAMEVPESEWDDGAWIVDPEGRGARITFLKVPEPKTVKNRLHLDVDAAKEPEFRCPSARSKSMLPS